MTSPLPTNLRGIVTDYIDATTTSAATTQDAALILDDDAHLIEAHLTGKWDEDDREHEKNAHQTIRTLIDTASPEDLEGVRAELSQSAEHLLGGL
ncbi:MAG: hypothetical protein ACTH0D_06875 [Candidatus Corynebacterium faecigallinarum]|uniref:Uncharacterized protein n=1 Tax=Candidatus Corynebacterium faecigallinarum TaxID=2838528 RepID=A0A9D2QDS6_9CORY|nr:hypothetical protein [Corynebacterium sp.]MDN6283781.1 hypothetical protein [Corynebacterium sp.]MDN6368830.1 hypothetical protein [Corynebacterium sp.]MDN6404651.1 hypothetical protein [Corynebacterium sp.]HJC85711.1 hypothetical protein [Candidatus Corynebacterium faecigallinarum]